MNLSRVFALSSLGCVAGLLVGCLVTSVHPFYTQQSLTFESGLIGAWAGEDSSERWEFKPHGESAYAVTYSEDGKDYAMSGHLFKVDGRLYLDLFAASPGESGESLLPPPIPSHMVLRVAMKEGNLEMSALDYEWLDKRLESEPDLLAHHRIKDEDGEDSRLVLTAESSALQAFLRSSPDDAWGDALELSRDDSLGTADGSD